MTNYHNPSQRQCQYVSGETANFNFEWMSRLLWWSSVCMHPAQSIFTDSELMHTWLCALHY